MNMNRVFVVAACRAPIGKTVGSLSGFSDVELMSLAFQEVTRRLGNIDVNIDGVYVGCCFPQESYNLARKALLAAGILDSVPGATVNRTCCSSMEALIQGARQIMVGEADVIAVGGVENMSRSPHVMKNAIKSARARAGGGLPAMKDARISTIDDVGLAVELLAHKLGIGREEQDAMACMSHRKAALAAKNGVFEREKFPVTVCNNGNNTLFFEDENVMPEITLSAMAGEEPVFLSDGTVTRLNSSSVNDGVAAAVLMSEKAAGEYGLEPLAEYLYSETVGVSPQDMALAPVNAISGLLQHKNLKLDDIDLIECNEAYAVQFLACQKLLDWDAEKVNVNGGSIALGHPLGCTGLRICITLIYAMLQRQVPVGLAAMCAGGGMGQSVLFCRAGKRSLLP